MEPSVSASLFVAAFSGLLAIVAAIITATSRWGYNADKRASSERMANVEKAAGDRATKMELEIVDLRREIGAVRDRLHADELETVGLKGELSLVKQRHEEHANDITEIKKQMVTRDLFEAHTRNINTQLDTILKIVSGGSGGYRQVRTPATPYRGGGESSEPPPRPGGR